MHISTVHSRNKQTIPQLRGMVCFFVHKFYLILTDVNNFSFDIPHF